MHAYASLFKITLFVSAIEKTKIRRKTHQYAYREFLWFSSTLFERRKMWNAQSINQSIKWLLLFSCIDYNNNNNDSVPTTIIYNMRKSLLKIIGHDKLSSSYCVRLFMRLCMCVCSRHTHTHIWLELNTKANKNEKEEREMVIKRREEAIFIFQSRRRKMAGEDGDSGSINARCREQKARENGNRKKNLYIYII